MKNSWWNRRWRLHKCVAWVKLKYNAYKNSWTIHSQSLLKHFALQTLRMWNFYHFKRTIFPYGTYECSQALHMDMNTNTHKFSNGWPFFTNRVHYTHISLWPIFCVPVFRQTWLFSSPSTQTYFVFCDSICKTISHSLVVSGRKCVHFANHFCPWNVRILWEQTFYCSENSVSEWIYVHNGKRACFYRRLCVRCFQSGN